MIKSRKGIDFKERGFIRRFAKAYKKRAINEYIYDEGISSKSA